MHPTQTRYSHLHDDDHYVMVMINIIVITITTTMTTAMVNMKTPGPWRQHNEYNNEMSMANAKARQ